MSVAEIKQELESLNTNDRIAVAAYLDELFMREEDAGLSAPWRNELKRRAKEIDNQEVELLPWTDVQKELERDFG